MAEKPGLWANIRKRRKSGKKPRKPGDKGAPSAADFRAAAATSKGKMGKSADSGPLLVVKID